MGRTEARRIEVDRVYRNLLERLIFIIHNAHALRRVRGGDEKLEAARSFKDRLDQGDELTPNQLSYIDGIYESTMKGMGLPSVGVKSDGHRRKW